MASVAFKDFEGADKCVAGMNKRWYAQRQLLVSLWDGITNYQVEETDEERSQRLKTWEKFLEEQQEQQVSDLSELDLSSWTSVSCMCY